MSITYPITKNDYFDRKQPAKSEELVNRVSVPVAGLTIAATASQLYKSEAAVNIEALGSVTITAEYSTVPAGSVAASLPSASAGVSIDAVATKYYAWGAVVVINNTGAAGIFVLLVKGKPYTAEAERVVIAEDTDSLLENGVNEYEVQGNHLIQSETIADLIAAKLLGSFKTPRKDCILDWRGDPALELGDVFEAPVYQRGAIDNRGDPDLEIDNRGLFYIFKNKIGFDGALSAATDGRKTS